MYEPDITQGTDLLRQLGSFFLKLYPYKPSIIAKLHSDEEIARQFQDSLKEIANKVSYNKCELSSTKRKVFFNLQKQDTFLHVGLKNLVTGNSYKFIETPTVGDIFFPSYKLPDNILYIKKITNKPINYSIELFPDIDFYIENSHIIFKNTKNLDYVDNSIKFWGHNVEYKNNNFYDVMGFLFFGKKDIDSYTKELCILLMFMIRYGMYEEKLASFISLFFHHPVAEKENEIVLEVYPGKVITDNKEYTFSGLPIVKKNDILQRLQPISDAVKIADVKNENFFVKNKQVHTHVLKTYKMKWNEFKYSIKTFKDTIGGRWNQQNYTEDSFFINLANNIIYAVYVKYTNTYSLKYLNNLLSAIPVWMRLNIHLKYTISEYYNHNRETLDSHVGKNIKEEYKSYADGQYAITKWNQLQWNNFDYGETVVQPYIKTIYQYHD